MENCKDKAGQGDRHPRHRRAADRGRAAVLAGLVRDAAERLGVPVQRHRACARSASATRSTTTTSRSSARTRCTACSSIPKDTPVDDRVERCRSSGPRTRWASRATPSSARAGPTIQTDYTDGRAGDQVAQVDLRRATASTTRAPCSMRKEAQVQGVDTGEGLGLLGAVLRQAAHPRRRGRGRGPVRVAELPAVRGQGLEPRARRLPQVRQEPRRLRCAGVHRR